MKTVTIKCDKCGRHIYGNEYHADITIKRYDTIEDMYVIARTYQLCASCEKECEEMYRNFKAWLKEETK